jgi:hypothetical protein
MTSFNRNAENNIEFDIQAVIPTVFNLKANTTIEFDIEVSERIGTIDAGIAIHASMFHQQETSEIQGGAIDLTKQIILSKLVQPTQVSFVSSSPIDINQVYAIEGIGVTGIVETEFLQLRGIVPVRTMREFVKLLRVVKQSGEPLCGNVTISNPHITVLASLLNINSSGNGFETTSLQALTAGFIGVPNDDRIYYEKLFIRNSTLDTINNFTLMEFSDKEGCFDFAFDPTFNASTTSSNRTTRPGVIPVANFNSLPKTVVNFLPGDSLGVWLRIKIPAGSPTNQKTLIFKIIADEVELLSSVITSESSAQLLSNVISHRASEALGGGLPLQFMELRGAHFVDQLFYEPDPVTFRSQFYYNTRINKLFKKINSRPRPVWKQVR